MQVRPLRPFFYKPVALAGVPLFYWKISVAATVFLAVFFFIFWRSAFGFPVWIILSMGSGLGLVAFFLWAHNARKRGWLEYSAEYYWRELIGIGQNLLAEKAGRKKTSWLIDAKDQPTKTKWLERA